MPIFRRMGLNSTTPFAFVVATGTSNLHAALQLFPVVFMNNNSIQFNPCVLACWPKIIMAIYKIRTCMRRSMYSLLGRSWDRSRAFSKQVLHALRYSACSLKFKYLLFSLRLSSICSNLHLFPSTLFFLSSFFYPYPANVENTVSS